ncbi:hypothetical protein CONCODRAFT_10725, partial [Conidiobolus coronatus NRRL 28638]
QVFESTGGYFNFPASIIAILCTLLLILGTKESTVVTTIGVIIKVSVILIVIFGIVDHVSPKNWTPFIPSNTDGIFGHFGILGIFKGARIAFKTYSGFELIGTMSQECINPQKNIPLSIITTLGTSWSCAISRVERILPHKYSGAVIGTVTTIIFGLLSQSRILYTLSNDGLLPKFFTKLHKKTNTPYISLGIIGAILSISAGLLPIEVLIEFTGILSFISFFFVNLTVIILRLKYPSLERGFKIPLGNYFIPVVGAAVSLALVATGSPFTLLRLFIWLIVGILFYLAYGLQNSRLNHPSKHVVTSDNGVNQIVAG